MKRTRRLTSSLDVSFRIPRSGLTPTQLNALKEKFKNILVATLAIAEKEGEGPLIKQKKSIRQFKVVKQWQSPKR
jgi:hypothetical protein